MVAIKKAFSNRPFTGALFYVVFLYVLEEVLFEFPQAKLLQLAVTFFSTESRLIHTASGIASFLFLYFFVWAALESSYIFQTIYTTLLALSLLVQYGYWKTVARFMISPDLKIAAATPIDTWKGASVLFFDWRFIVPVIGFVCLLLICSERQGLRPSLTKFGSLVLFIAVLAVSQTLISKPINLGLSFSSFYQTTTRFVIESMLPPKREKITYRHSYLPRNNIILVIDESIRGDHFSINGYARETTPFLRLLAAREDGFYNWGLAVAGATCSYPSNNLILTGVRPGLDEFGMTAKYPTVFQYAKAMGYKTYYMDAQTNSLWNGLTDQDISYVDEWLKAGDFGNDYQSDFRAADRISKILSGGVGSFIVLNKRGVHFLYEDTYPPQMAVWLPAPGTYDRQPELVKNPYDNGILYNVNNFFERLLADRSILEHTIILYTSDHGQTLFENHVRWLHCNFTPQEAMVPLILIGKNIPSVDTSYRASHSNILPTLLDLMGVPPDQRIHPYAPSLFSGKIDLMTDHFFFDGGLRLIDFPDPWEF